MNRKPTGWITIHPPIWQIAAALLLAVGLWLLGPVQLTAADGPPNRSYTITTPYTEYEWWLIRWTDKEVLCEIYVDHPGNPTPNEIYYGCGVDLYQLWEDTAPCAQSGADSSQCTGVYLYQANSAPREKQVTLTLPSAEAWISVENCPPEELKNYCREIPHLLIKGYEPLPNEKILSIQGRLDGIPFFCEGNICQVDLRPTPDNGIIIEFWTNSSFGDTSQRYTGRIRLLPSHKKSNDLPDGWRIDLVSERWKESDLRGCVERWKALPAPGALPYWLSFPLGPEQLATDQPLAYLAGKLIVNNLADASACPHYGLLENGYASPCGIAEIRPELVHWQNSFDPIIFEEAQKASIPPVLLKRIFMQESQFWPETLEVYYQEYGFGHLTDQGADVILLWNETFFREFCPLVISREFCQLGYVNLDEEFQALLRGALLSQTSIPRDTIALGIHPDQARQNIHLFSQTVLGNCNQVGQMIENTTEELPGISATYEDLWRFTLASYYGGAGCLAEAIESNAESGNPLTWEHISAELEHECPRAVDYVESITR
jgi:hypothetical protein